MSARAGGSDAARRLSTWVLLLLGCSALPGGRATTDGAPAPPLTDPTQLCVGDPSEAAARCRSPREVERWLAGDSLTIVGRRETGGAQGAVALTLRSPEATFDAKWRAASSASEHNDPLGELGAHHVQKLILDPVDYVVPPAASHCFPEAEYRRWFRSDDDSVEDMECVLGYLSYWLTGSIGLTEARLAGLVPAPRGDAWSADAALYDPARFPHQSGAYRRNVAHLNVIAFLARNGDAHAAQFVSYRRPLHVFLVDSSVAFSAPQRASMRGRQDLSELVVRAIPADTAERVGELGRDEVMALMRIAEHRRADLGWERVAPGPLLADGRGRLRREGDRVQVGLSRDDARGVLERLRILQEALRSGAIGTFDRGRRP